MPLDTIIVLVLAIAFFGGLIYLALKTRRDRNNIGPTTPPPGGEEERRPAEMRERKRRKVRN